MRKTHVKLYMVYNWQVLLIYIHIHIYIFIYLYLFIIHLAVLSLGCSIWDLVPWPGIELGSPALGVPNVSH